MSEMRRNLAALESEHERTRNYVTNLILGHMIPKADQLRALVEGQLDHADEVLAKAIRAQGAIDKKVHVRQQRGGFDE